jgi:biopolymer transport protein ExbB
MAGLAEMLARGGPVVAVLLALSALSVALIVVKLIDLRGVLSGEAGRAEALDAWGRGDRAAATEALARGRAPADRVLRHAMLGLQAGRARPVLDADLEWRGNAEVAAMTRHLRLLELIAMVSPLLGLLGTVLGMIRAFQDLALAEGAANAALLADGIWTALLTTAAGLVVAIPAAIAAGLFASRAEAAAQRIEAAVGRLYALADGAAP